MRRARQTIDALFPDVEEHVDTRLRERALGEWEGLSKHEVRDEWPAAFLDSGPLDPRFTPPGGEELVSLQGRIRAFLVDLCELGPESALVMTHNGCIRTVKATLGKIRLDEFFVESEEPGHPYFVSWSELHDARKRGVI